MSLHQKRVSNFTSVSSGFVCISKAFFFAELSVSLSACMALIINTIINVLSGLSGHVCIHLALRSPGLKISDQKKVVQIESHKCVPFYISF